MDVLYNIVSSHCAIATKLTPEGVLSGVLHGVPLVFYFSVRDVAAHVAGESHPCVLSQVSLKEVVVLGGKAAFGAAQLRAVCQGMCFACYVLVRYANQ